MIVIDANHDIGGHAMLSGGRIPLGGGTSLQKKYNISRFRGPGVSGSHQSQE